MNVLYYDSDKIPQDKLKNIVDYITDITEDKVIALPKDLARLANCSDSQLESFKENLINNIDKEIEKRKTDVKIAKWIHDPVMDDMYNNYYKCSRCGREVGVFYKDNVYEKKPYCNCGAKMLNKLKVKFEGEL